MDPHTELRVFFVRCGSDYPPMNDGTFIVICETYTTSQPISITALIINVIPDLAQRILSTI